MKDKKIDLENTSQKLAKSPQFIGYRKLAVWGPKWSVGRSPVN